MRPCAPEGGEARPGPPKPALPTDREPTLWERKLAEEPGHSQWYIDRFRRMAAEGADLVGEARLIDAMVPRGARILDAGCGPGRLGGHLHRQGHTVVGVDVDPALIEAAQADHPGPTWLVGDLAHLDLPARGVTEPFDVAVAAGNVMVFAAPSTRVEVLRRMAAHLTPTGRIVVGFHTDRDYPVPQLRRDLVEAGLTEDLLLATWDLRPYRDDSDFVVAVMSRAGGAPGSS